MGHHSAWLYGAARLSCASPVCASCCGACAWLNLQQLCSCALDRLRTPVQCVCLACFHKFTLPGAFLNFKRSINKFIFTL